MSTRACSEAGGALVAALNPADEDDDVRQSDGLAAPIDVSDIKQFVMMCIPKSQTQPVQCYIKRCRSGLQKLWPYYVSRRFFLLVIAFKCQSKSQPHSAAFSDAAACFMSSCSCACVRVRVCVCSSIEVHLCCMHPASCSLLEHDVRKLPADVAALICSCGVPASFEPAEFLQASSLRSSCKLRACCS